MMEPVPIFTPDRDRPDPVGLAALTARLATLAERTAQEGPWRSGAFDCLAQHGLLAGFVPTGQGGLAAGEPALLAALAAVAEHCLTTALAVSQWASAVRIIVGGPPAVRAARLPPLARGESPVTVGISQLTTSRQHVGQPVLTARRDGPRWRLDGLCPWVTGADSSAAIVTGAATPAGHPTFFIVPTDAAGLVIEPPLAMLALSGSRTSVVTFDGVEPADVIEVAGDAGPRAGGLATSALALGAARAAITVVRHEAGHRRDLATVVTGLAGDAEDLATRLDSAASAGSDAEMRDALRTEATSLAVRAAQAALTAAKGAGFIRGHPAERLAREALFFLVWSCPHTVAAKMLCDLAGAVGARHAAGIR